jgi:hypothetical protein
MENNSESVNFTKRKQTSDKGWSKFQSPRHNGMGFFGISKYVISKRFTINLYFIYLA